MDSLTELRYIAVFAQVVDARSYAGAARQLGVTRSAVSKQIARLEDHLGARLLQRTSRQLGLTEAGRRLYEHARRIVAESNEATAEVRGLQSEVRGTLCVSAPLALERTAAAVVHAFSAGHPQLTVELRLGDGYADLVAEEVDVTLRIGRLEDSSLRARRVTALPQVVCAAPAYLRARGRPAAPEELGEHDCVLYTFDDEPRRWRFSTSGRRRDVRVHGRIWTNTAGGLKTFAMDGAGIVMLPLVVVRDELRRGQLETVLDDHPVPAASLQLVYPARAHLSAKVRAFLDHAVEALPAHLA